jgi:Fic family protein
MERYERVYSKLSRTETIIAAAAAHHRLVWIHPFLDGNGRVARLVSHATFLATLETGALWSVARGLGRNAAAYKALLANCDLTRRNDLDGRGPLSEEHLTAFTEFFLKTCLNQVVFMENLVELSRLRARILMWADEEIRMGALPPNSGAILQAILYRGQLPRGEAASAVGASERTARRIVSALLARGILVSENPRAPLRLRFPAALAGRWLPGLFPDP